MAGEGTAYLLDKSYKANGALDQYQVVVFHTTSEGYVKSPAASGEAAIAGVVQEKAAASGDTVRVTKHGISKVIAQEALTQGQQVVIANANGRVCNPGSFSAGNGVIGTMEEGATASGDIVRCWLQIDTVR